MLWMELSSDRVCGLDDLGSTWQNPRYFGIGIIIIGRSRNFGKKDCILSLAIFPLL